MPWRAHLPQQLIDSYEVHNYRHAAEVLATAYPDELAEIVRALLAFNLTTQDIKDPGGNESGITKRFRNLLQPNGWLETKVTADLLVRRAVGKNANDEDGEANPDFIRKGYIEGHKIDFVKGSVALDFEWNSKDQTFDRDLYALRTFYECGVIAAGVLVTRSEAPRLAFTKNMAPAQLGWASCCHASKRAEMADALSWCSESRHDSSPTGVSRNEHLGSYA